MPTSAQSKATATYIAKRLRTYVIRYHKVNEADVIAWLDSKENKTATIKEAIREKMEKER